METSPEKKLAGFACLIPLPMFLLLPLALLFMQDFSGAIWHGSLSLDAFLGAEFFWLFFAVGIASVPLALYIKRKLEGGKNAVDAIGAKTISYAMSEVPLVLGFVLAFVNKNAWLMAPFFALAAALYACIYMTDE